MLRGLRARKGKYRVVGIDRFEPPGEGHWVVGDYDSLEEALAVARDLTLEAAALSDSPSMSTVYYVYDDEGRYCGGDIYGENADEDEFDEEEEQPDNG